ncbi:hypothetical protein [Dickeya dadantii]|uniref:hypothetical protein n=1 Tax=Dickeya dadantii TaxID=204038 RepID=UPI000575FD3C|nr:hypothetical protein [Dickeya dadantii]
MLYTKQAKKHIYFIGQNSHGSDESWAFRNAFIHKLRRELRSIVLVECPTIDLIVFALRRFRKINTGDMSYLTSSAYWWMRSEEFATFLRALPATCVIAGIDLPLSTTLHENYIKSIRLVPLAEQRLLISLLEFDRQSTLSMTGATPEQRETAMAEKIGLAIQLGYELIFVICHNFHATHTSWLHYPSLCQTLGNKFHGSIDITSYGVFSENMTFLATPDGHSLSTHSVRHACKKMGNQTYRVKMISSLYRTETRDAMELILNTPRHFDEFVIFPNGKCLTMELF